MSKIYLSPEATLEEMVALMIMGKGTITFGNKDLSRGGLVHNNTLYVTVTCLHKYMSLTLFDNGSVVNLCPWRTTRRLGIKEYQLSKPTTYLRVYDNSKRLVLHTTLLPINASPFE